MNQKQKTQVDEVNAKVKKEELQIEILKVQLQNEKVKLKQQQATLHKTNLEIRLLEKELNIPTSGDMMRLKQNDNTETVEKE